MTIEELEALIAQGEGQQLEFKRSLAELETAVRTLAAFANTEGGTVLFGVRQSGEKVVGFRRREVTEYPYEAVREAVCNAVCHRDYTMTGSAVRVMVFDDRIEVNSPGGLPPSVTIQNIERKHVLRNTLLANFLYDIFYIEKWGAGITKPALSLPKGCGG